MVEQFMEGIVISGLGEGAFFMSMNHYKKEIKKRLGFDAYQGTLNIKASKEKIVALKKSNSIKIAGFKKGEKTFGGVSCYKAGIVDIDGALIMPDINKHKDDVIEFIAPVNVKSKLNIKDGDKIKVELK